MRQIYMTGSLYDWMSKVLEDDTIQHEMRKFENMEELTEIYELFHKKEKTKVKDN